MARLSRVGVDVIRAEAAPVFAGFFEGRGRLRGGSFPKHSEKREPVPPTSPRKPFSRPPQCATLWSPEVSRVTTRSGRGQGPQSRPAFLRSVCLFLSPRTRQTPSR